MKAIMYHYVQPEDPAFPYFKNLHVDDFRRQLDFFEQTFGFVRREDFLIAVEEGQTLPEGVVLTFDDGLKCHYRYVFPELQRRGLWGIFYIATQPYMEGTFIDVHKIHLLLGKHGGRVVYEALMEIFREEMLQEGAEEAFRDLTYSTQQNDTFTLLVKRMLNYFISYQYRDQVLQSLLDALIPGHAGLLSDFYLSSTEMQLMQQHGMVLGSHTVHHPVLSRLSTEEQFREIADSFAYLLRVLQAMPIRTFCYPYGGFHSFNNETIRILEEQDCTFAFNVEQRAIEVADLQYHRQYLPRFDCNQFPHGQCR